MNELTENEKEVYEYALRDEFKGMGIPIEQQNIYIDKILNGDRESIIYLKKNGAIAVSREIVQDNNHFGV